MNNTVINEITTEINAAFSPEKAVEIGILSIKTANQTLDDASTRPDPEELYHELWYEGEVCCLFADSNLGKSIFAVQIADHVSRCKKVLYVDCELSDKQFQLRYTERSIDPETQDERISVHRFSENFLRATIDPDKLTEDTYGADVIGQIEHTAVHNQVQVIFIDNITFLCSTTEKGDDAGKFMLNLLKLKKKYGWSVMVMAHTPKRDPWKPITQDDLAGSKKLANFFDSILAIGASSKGDNIRYVKQVKARSVQILYGADNVAVYTIEKVGNFLQFRYDTTSPEQEHLKEKKDGDIPQEVLNVLELINEGKSLGQIAKELGINKTRVYRIKQRYLPIYQGAVQSVQSLQALARNYMTEPEIVTVGTRNAGAENVEHFYYNDKGGRPLRSPEAYSGLQSGHLRNRFLQNEGGNPENS